MTEATELERRHGASCGCLRCIGLRGAVDGVPFEPGNRAALRHGAYASPQLRELDRVEVAELAVAIEELLPFRRPAFGAIVEQLAVRLWRQRRALADLSENGLLRDGKPAPILAHLATLENGIARDLDALGLTPRAAAGLGVDLARGELARDALERLEAEGRRLRLAREGGAAG